MNAWLRSWPTPEGGRHFGLDAFHGASVALRSSPAPEGAPRHESFRPFRRPVQDVAILARPGGW
ncbi:hypothetical protein AB0J52_15420, partial [Spirillospora sp. NPDC049652]